VVFEAARKPGSGQHRRRCRRVLVTGDAGQLHTLPVRGQGETPLRDRRPAGVVPALISGGDFVVEPARPELVDGPAASLGLVVKAGQDREGRSRNHTHQRPSSLCAGAYSHWQPGTKAPIAKGASSLHKRDACRSVSLTSAVSVSRTTSATAARGTRWSRSCIKEMVVLTRPPVAVPSGPTVSASNPAGL
jgi:hypothetical protein